jgi:alkanesulfonate monooxygenase SsuD/methylene tetrahydromethanopterin reductase-like flavin-dependent oxidoreductase (luciferase family)
MPKTPPPIFVATSGPINAERTGRTCDGIITVGAADDKIKMLMERFEKGAFDAGKDPFKMPRIIQLHVSWAATDEEAVEQTVKEWPNGGMNFPKQDIRNPEDFEAMQRLVRPENFKGRVFMSADLDAHRAHIQHFIDLGFNEVYIHNVGRNQTKFIQAYGKDVIPNIRWPKPAVPSDDESDHY